MSEDLCGDDLALLDHDERETALRCTFMCHTLALEPLSICPLPGRIGEVVAQGINQCESSLGVQ